MKKEKAVSKKPPSRQGHLVTICLNPEYKKKWYQMKTETKLLNADLLKYLIDRSKRKWND